MSTVPQITIPKIRTYAADLDEVRASKPAVLVDNTKSPVAISNVQAPLKTSTPNNAPGATVTAITSSVAVPQTLTKTDTQSLATKISAKTLSDASTGKDVMPAVVITDTKHKRFNITTAIADSIVDWWGEKKDQAQKSKVPKYTVPHAELRKGVV
jgi:hypothetical protein